jgi:hypothetical protein
MSERKILINRAPVLTLWAVVVAERLGSDHDEALSLAKAVAGPTAQSRGQRLGIYKPVPLEIKRARARKRGEEIRVEICGRAIPAINTSEGVRAVVKDKPVQQARGPKVARSPILGLLRAIVPRSAWLPANLIQARHDYYRLFGTRWLPQSR